MNTHTNERPFQCPDCTAAFAQQNNMQTHWKTQHSEDAQQHQRKQEARVEKALQAAGIDFKREHHVALTCVGKKHASIDFLILVDGGILIVEVDERQHLGYPVECELSRMANIHAALRLDGNTMPICVFRYNPHEYKVNGTNVRKMKKQREKKLVDMIKGWKFVPDSDLQVLYMYYDAMKQDDVVTLKIWDDSAYDATIRNCCLPPIV